MTKSDKISLIIALVTWIILFLEATVFQIEIAVPTLAIWTIIGLIIVIKVLKDQL